MILKVTVGIVVTTLLDDQDSMLQLEDSHDEVFCVRMDDAEPA
jgi:hypothetical protein